MPFANYSSLLVIYCLWLGYLNGALSTSRTPSLGTQTCAHNRVLGLQCHGLDATTHSAKAEAGQNEGPSSTKRPVNACCSKDGFCDSTKHARDLGRQSNCGKSISPNCGGSFSRSARQRRIGYYQSWSQKRKCYGWPPFLIDARKWTHLNYAFAAIDPQTYQVAQMNSDDTKLYSQFTSLKEGNPALQVYVSIGGWEAGGAVFSSMVSTKASRNAFIDSAIKFMRTYAFDGIDISCQYPTAKDRGGDKADAANFVIFIQELRDAIGTSFGLTVALPSSSSCLKGFDLEKMEPYVDWFNLMSYDIHGKWDNRLEPPSAVVQAHSNLTEIDEALNWLWHFNIKPSKVVLGLGFYGRSFTPKDPTCTKPGCPILGGGEPGECTDTSGILSWNEIRDAIEDKDLTPVLDQCDGVKYVTWDDDQWASYDDAETFAIKMNYASFKCLGGINVWAVDLDVIGDGSAINALLEDDPRLSSDMRATLNHDNGANLGIFWTPCLPPKMWSWRNPCPAGYKATWTGYGKVFDADLDHLTGPGCHGGGRNGWQRVLCVEETLTLDCQWGPGARSKACNSKCPEGWITLTKNSHIGGQDIGCKSGKYAPLCCQSIKNYRSNRDTCYNDIRNQHLAGGLALRTVVSNSRLYNWVSDDESSVAVKEHERLTARQFQDKANAALSLVQGVDVVGACPDALPRDQIGLDIPVMLRKPVAHADETSTHSSSTTLATSEEDHMDTFIAHITDGHRHHQFCTNHCNPIFIFHAPTCTIRSD